MRNIAWVTIFLTVFGYATAVRLLPVSKQPVWHDEVYSLVQSTGQQVKTVTQNLQENSPVAVNEVIEKLSSVKPNNYQEIVWSLAIEDPQHPPLYYLSLSSWRNLFGESWAAARTLSVLAGVLTCISLGVLAFQVTASPSATLITFCLAAASPILLQLSLMIRSYPLWVLFMSLSLNCLLCFNRSDKWKSAYFIVMLCSYYTHLLTVCAHLAHTCYILYTEKLRLTEKLKDYLTLSFFLLLGILPWGLVVLVNVERSSASLSWLSQPSDFSGLLTAWQSLLSASFVGCMGENCLPHGYQEYAIGFFSLFGVIAVASLMLNSKTRSASIVLFGYLAFILLPTIGLDLALGGIRSTIQRYFFLANIAVIVATALVLYRLCCSQRTIGILLTIGLITLQSYFQFRFIMNPHSLTTYCAGDFLEVRKTIQSYPKPLIFGAVQSQNIGNMLAFSTYVADTDVDFYISKDHKVFSRYDLCRLSKEYSHIVAIEGAKKALYPFRECCLVTETSIGYTEFTADIYSFQREGKVGSCR